MLLARECSWGGGGGGDDQDGLMQWRGKQKSSLAFRRNHLVIDVDRVRARQGMFFHPIPACCTGFVQCKAKGGLWEGGGHYRINRLYPPSSPLRAETGNTLVRRHVGPPLANKCVPPFLLHLKPAVQSSAGMFDHSLLTNASLLSSSSSTDSTRSALGTKPAHKPRPPASPSHPSHCRRTLSQLEDKLPATTDITIAQPTQCRGFLVAG